MNTGGNSREKGRKNRMKKLIIYFIIAIMIMSNGRNAYAATNQKCETIERKIRKKYKKVCIMKSGKKCDRAIDHRAGKTYVVEKVTGTVKSGVTGRGITDRGFYISYGKLKNVRKGDKVITYLVYNPQNNACDDIMARYDIVMQRNKK